MTTDEYILAHTQCEPDYLAAINRSTHLRMVNPRMLSGHYQGRVLAMLTHMIQPKCVLEIGTFTGYSALCMAEAMPQNAILHTIERDDELEDFIRANFDSVAHGKKIVLHIGHAVQLIPEIQATFDLVFIDADKREYSAYYEAVLPKLKRGGFILVDNTLWDGKVLHHVDASDKQTIEIKQFNDYVAHDDRVETIMFPIRDGLSIIRKV